MGSRRIVVLVVAVVVGLLAALAAYSYLSGTQARANRGARLVQVYVVKKEIKKGTPGEKALAEKAIAIDVVPARFQPPTVVVRPEELKGNVAVVDLSPNQIVIHGLFVEPRVANTTNSQRLDPNNVAVSVSLDQVHSVGGLLAPGDAVNIMARRKSGPNNNNNNNKAEQGLAVLYQNVKILFIGTSAAPQPGEAQAAVNPGSGIITFQAPMEAAQRIVWASTAEGGIYLALVPPNNAPAVFPPVNDENEFGPPCTDAGPDGRYTTADDNPAGCVPLSPYGPPTSAPGDKP